MRINPLEHQRLFEKQSNENSRAEGKTLQGYVCKCALWDGSVHEGMYGAETEREEQITHATYYVVDLERELCL